MTFIYGSDPQRRGKEISELYTIHTTFLGKALTIFGQTRSATKNLSQQEKMHWTQCRRWINCIFRRCRGNQKNCPVMSLEGRQWQPGRLKRRRNALCGSDWGTKRVHRPQIESRGCEPEEYRLLGWSWRYELLRLAIFYFHPWQENS
jgi:hypothetical protein